MYLNRSIRNQFKCTVWGKQLSNLNISHMAFPSCACNWNWDVVVFNKKFINFFWFFFCKSLIKYEWAEHIKCFQQKSRNWRWLNCNYWDYYSIYLRFIELAVKKEFNGKNNTKNILRIFQLLRTFLWIYCFFPKQILISLKINRFQFLQNLCKFI